MSKACLRWIRAFFESLDEFTSKYEPSTIKYKLEGFLWVEIIVKRLPFLEWIDAKVIQKLKKLHGKYLSALSRKVLATGASALVSTGNRNCLAIKSERRFSVKQDLLLAQVEFLIHVANSIVVWGPLRPVTSIA